MLDFSFLFLGCLLFPPAPHPQQNFSTLELLVSDCLELQVTLKESIISSTEGMRKGDPELLGWLVQP